MRTVAYALALVALAGAGLAAEALRAALTDPLPAPEAAAARHRDAGLARPEAVPPQPPGPWPELFGAVKVPQPRPPAPPEPEPPAAQPVPPEPPLASLGYGLKGLVSSGAARWAILGHPTGELLLRVGDRLGDSAYTVTAIDVRGLWAAAPGAEPQLLGFDP